MMDLWQEMSLNLDRLAQEDLFRELRVVQSPHGARITLGDRTVMCFCGNDYLCLANHPRLKASAVDAIERWGVGSGASRLVSGTSAVHEELERRLADFKRCAGAVVVSTGWMANHVAMHALANKGDLVLCDKLNHASIIDAARSCGATMRTYPHRDARRLRNLLDRLGGRYRRRIIVTDSLFSMDGDLADLRELAKIKREYDALLMIDEAHATGVLGDDGRGAAEMLGVEDQVDVTVGTLSKAIGCMGGFVAGPGVLRDWIINSGRQFIYTTAPPASICAAAITALDVIRDQPERRKNLLELGNYLRARLDEAGLCVGADSVGPIVPVIVHSPTKALSIGARLLEEGFLVGSIRPPTVAPGSSRLRISLCCDHTRDDIDALVSALVGAM